MSCSPWLPSREEGCRAGPPGPPILLVGGIAQNLFLIPLGCGQVVQEEREGNQQVGVVLG